MKALVLSGGGSKGAYQAGVLRKWLREDKINYDLFCGSSVGALSAAFLAQFADPAQAYSELEAVWSTLRTRDVYHHWWARWVSALWRKSVFDSEPLVRTVKDRIHVDRIRKSGNKVRVVAVSWQTGQTRVVGEDDDDLTTWVAASAAFPIAFSPVVADGEEWGDGGLRNATPLGEAIRAGATEVDVILTFNPDKMEKYKLGEAAFPSRALRAYEILSSQVQVADLNVCGLKNDLAEINPKYRKVKLRVVYPREPLGVNPLEFDLEVTERLMALGYEDAAKVG